MACGCIVIGYTGRGGKEYFKPGFSLPVEDRDIIGMAKAVEKVIRRYKQNKNFFLEKGLRASKHILHEYSIDRQEHAVIGSWEKIFRKK
ncbi:MAG: hypothetical protein HY589_00960 [Candidatus Omnitrophica bacterium]|nr:hypothetical protein [Candidatus Omnitrophota bacterium]